MYPTHDHIAEQIARQYTRDRIRDAEARRAARAARIVARAPRIAAQERRYADPADASVATGRRWWFFSAPTTRVTRTPWSPSRP